MFPDGGIEAFVRRFQARSVSRAEWTHEAHLAVGLWHVARLGRDDALARLRAGITALNEANGVANTPTGGYHETITRAYVRLIAGFLARRGVTVPTSDDVQGDIAALIADPLAGRAALLAYWTPGCLMSSRARTAWVAPDRKALPP